MKDFINLYSTLAYNNFFDEETEEELYEAILDNNIFELECIIEDVMDEVDSPMLAVLYNLLPADPDAYYQEILESIDEFNEIEWFEEKESDDEEEEEEEDDDNNDFLVHDKNIVIPDIFLSFGVVFLN